MNDSPVSQGNAVETTDCLEAVGVFRGWKNFFFVIVLICLLLVQIAFWFVDLGAIETTPAEAAGETPLVGQANLTENAIGAVLADANAPDANAAEAQAQDDGFIAGVLGGFDFDFLSRTIDLVNGILIVTAVLYALTMFFSLLVSLVGRLGGINHISRAFVLSLIMVVLIIPWQKLFGSNVVGVVWAPAELVQWLAVKGDSTVNMIIYYLRFVGYWFVVLLPLLMLSQVRSARWSKAILRRLEII